MTIQEQRRKAFERKYWHEMPPAMKWDEERQTYCGHSLFWLWGDRLKTWCEALDSLEVELPDFPNGRDSTYFAMVEAIERAGLKVKP